MIHFPTTILDNFFDNPHDIINISKSSKITWKPSENGSWPGVRSQSLVNINKDLFMFIIKKYFFTFFNYEDMDAVNCQAMSVFQRIGPKTKYGWVHNDFPDIHTFIIYLTPNANLLSGTCTYNTPASYLKKLPLEKDKYLMEIKKSHYLGKTSIEEAESARLEHNSQFEKNVMVGNRFNRLVGFDSHIYHGVEEFGTGTEERLTLITFIHKLSCPPTPYQRMKVITDV